jgi:hypothetical protein
MKQDWRRPQDRRLPANCSVPVAVDAAYIQIPQWNNQPFDVIDIASKLSFGADLAATSNGGFCTHPFRPVLPTSW